MQNKAPLQLTFEFIGRKKPGTHFSTVWFLILRWTLRIIGFLLLLSGLSLMIASLMTVFVVDKEWAQYAFEISSENIQNTVLEIQFVAGLFLLLNALLLLFIAGLCRRIVRRSNYMEELENFIEAQIIPQNSPTENSSYEKNNP